MKKGLLKKGLLLPVGLIIALLVPSVAFGAIVTFTGSFPTDSNASISFDVQRVNGRNTQVNDMSLRKFNVNCTKSGRTQIHTRHGGFPINAAVQQRTWNYDDGTTHFQGTFRKASRNKADGTLEINGRIDIGLGKEHCRGGPRTWHAHL
jgi:hypothetical protein